MQYGMRVGWNARGGTDAEHLRIDKLAAKARMHAALQPLQDALGEDAYRAWVEETIADTDTISEIVEKAGREMARLEQDATCTCNPNTVSACPACVKALGQSQKIPF